MKIMVIIFNIVLFGFTCLVTLTDGPPREAGYIVFSLLLVLVPILNVVMISRSGTSGGWLGFHLKQKASAEQRKMDNTSSISTVMKIVAIICNIVLLGFACWAIIDQYPHPREAGVIEFGLLVILTPIISAVVIFRSGKEQCKQ